MHPCLVVTPQDGGEGAGNVSREKASEECQRQRESEPSAPASTALESACCNLAALRPRSQRTCPNRSYVVICTHNHFDHVGGAAGFAGSEICMGKQNPTYSKNLEVTSLAAGVGARVKPFEVTRWLEDGDEVWLDDSDRSRFNRLSVHFTPGHALDHIAVFFERELRLFVGDTLYPFTAIDLANMGSNVPDYRATLGKIAALASRAETAGIPAAPAGTGAAHAAPKTVGDPPAAEKPAGSPGAAPQGPAGPAAAAPGPEAAKGAAVSEAASTAIAEVEAKASKVKQLLDEWLGIPEDEAAASFDPWGVMEACGWDVAAAATAIQDLGDAAGEIAPPGSYAMPTSTDEVRRLLGIAPAARTGPSFPPAAGTASSGSGPGAALRLPAPPAPSEPVLTLACGHVDPALPASLAVAQAGALLEGVLAGAVEPCTVSAEDATAEYRGESYAFVLPHPLPAPKGA